MRYRLVPVSDKVEKVNDKPHYEKDEVMIVISAMNWAICGYESKASQTEKNEGFSTQEI